MQLIILATCVSDFFQGTTKPVLAVPIEKLTTLTQFANSLKREYNENEFPVESDQFDTLVTNMVNEMEEEPFDHLDADTSTSLPIYAYVALFEA